MEIAKNSVTMRVTLSVHGNESSVRENEARSSRQVPGREVPEKGANCSPHTTNLKIFSRPHEDTNARSFK